MAKWIIGLAIGLVIGLILVIVMHYTVFKKNTRLVWLYVVILLVFSAGGAAIQSYYFSKALAEVPTPQETIDKLTNEISDNWKNTNGGFNFDQIKKAQEDDSCPTADDKIISLKCYDFGSYVCFSYKNGNRYENALFYKSSEGLILDGVMNVIGYFDGGAKWFLEYRSDRWKWIDQRDSEPKLLIYRQLTNHDNFISLSSQDLLHFFSPAIGIRRNTSKAYLAAWAEATHLTSTNAATNFIKFGDVELIGQAEEGFVKINSFYNYLYNAVCGKDFDTYTYVDASEMLCLPIPADKQSTYPIPESKRADYDGALNYGVYNCTIAVNVNFVKGKEQVIRTFSNGKVTESNINSSTKNASYINTLKNDEERASLVAVETVEPRSALTTLNMTFKDTGNSDLTGLDLREKPVKITFTSGDLTKKVAITDVNKINNGVAVLLAGETSWQYRIDSEGLLFENFQGSFTLGKNAGEMNFNYYYLSNFVVASVGLNPVGTIDMTKLDLQAHPVRIILSHKTEDYTYSFTFNNNNQLNQTQTKAVKLGEYDYTILSDQLTFASETGSLTITATDRTMLFNCALIEEEKDYIFTATMSKIAKTGSDQILHFAGLNLQQIYNEDSNSKLRIAFYDKQNGELLNDGLYHRIGDIIEDAEDEEQYYQYNKGSALWSYSKNRTMVVQVSLNISSVIYTSDLAEFSAEDNPVQDWLLTLNFNKN